MFNGIIYIMSFIYFFISILLIKKKKESANLFLWCLISYYICWIINSLIVFIFSLFNMPANLFVRSLLMIIIASYLIYYTFKNNNIQKYNKLSISNAIIVLFLFIICVLIGYKRTKFTNIVFETTDPAVHYLFAERFSESNKLLEFSKSDFYYGGQKTDKSMFFSYTYMGTLFQLSHSFGLDDRFDVLIFNIFEIIVLFISCAVLYYFFVSKFKKNEVFSKITIFILLMLYLFGYPLNNFIFGFHYLGLFILNAIIIIVTLAEFKNYNNKIFMLILALELFTVFTTYYLFVPAIYGGVGLYYLYLWIIQKKYSFKEILNIMLFTLIIPFMVGFLYYFVYNHLFLSSLEQPSNAHAFKVEGYIYRNLIGNFIVLIPVCIYSFINNIKNKKINLIDMLLIFEFIYAAGIYYFFYNGEFASYYFYKNHFLIWMLLYANLGYIISEKNKNTYGFCVTTIFTILAIVLVNLSNIELNLNNKNALLNPKPFSSTLTDIYEFNNTKIYNQGIIYTAPQIKDLVDVYGKSIPGKTYFYEKDLFKRLWAYDFTGFGYNPLESRLFAFYEDGLSPDDLLNNDSIKQIIVFHGQDTFENNNYNKIYENADFILYEKRG